MPPISRRHRATAPPRTALAAGLAALAAGLAALVLLTGAAPAAAEPVDDDEPVDIAGVIDGLDLFPEGRLDEQRLASFTAALSRAAVGPQEPPAAARSLAVAAQQFQHLQQRAEVGDRELRRAYLAALAAELDAARANPGHPALLANLDRLAAQVEQYGAAEASGSGGSVREGPGDSIASRRGPALALIGLALAALALGVVRLTAGRRDRTGAD